MDPFSAKVEEVIEFLTSQYNTGVGYETLNTARAALSALGLNFGGFACGSHPLVIRYMKGIFTLRPPKPRHAQVWDVNKVLGFLRTLSPVKHLTLKNLTLKLTMLMALSNAARVQTLQLLSVEKLEKNRSAFKFMLQSSLKQNRPAYNINSVQFKAYPPDRRLCVYTVIKEYLRRTEPVRQGCDSLLLSYVKPYGPVTRATIARWIKTVMQRAGINIQMFGAHSVRSAATSTACYNNVPISDILKAAGWTRENTFAKYYRKPVEKEDRFQQGVLTGNRAALHD